MHDQWTERDSVVLNTFVELWEKGSPDGEIEPDDIAAATGLDVFAVQQALVALSDAEPPLIRSNVKQVAGHFVDGGIGRPTERARRLTGAWPSEETP